MKLYDLIELLQEKSFSFGNPDIYIHLDNGEIHEFGDIVFNSDINDVDGWDTAQMWVGEQIDDAQQYTNQFCGKSKLTHEDIRKAITSKI